MSQRFNLLRGSRLRVKNRDAAPSSQPCIQAASTLYCGIVDEVVANDYDVFTRRASVPIRRRLAVAGPAAVRAVRARR